MKYAVFHKVPVELTEDVTCMENFLRKSISHTKYRLFIKSKTWRNLSMQMAPHGNDFPQGMISIRIVGNIYKISRIIKQSYFKKRK